MNLEEAGHYALSLGETVTEDQFTRNWYCWRVDGKWFMLTDLDIPESQISLKLHQNSPESSWMSMPASARPST